MPWLLQLLPDHGTRCSCSRFLAPDPAACGCRSPAALLLISGTWLPDPDADHQLMDPAAAAVYGIYYQYVFGTFPRRKSYIINMFFPPFPRLWLQEMAPAADLRYPAPVPGCCSRSGSCCRSPGRGSRCSQFRPPVAALAVIR